MAAELFGFGALFIIMSAFAFLGFATSVLLWLDKFRVHPGS